MDALSHEEWAQLCHVMNGYVLSQTLTTACELDLFGFLSKAQNATQEEVCNALKLSSYSGRVLLLTCCAAGLINKDSSTGTYANSPLASKVLMKNSEYSMVPFIRFNSQIQHRCSTHFTPALVEGRNAGLDEFPGEGKTLYERLTHYPELERLFQDGMAAYTRLSPKIENLSEFEKLSTLLDVGGGDATTAIRLCRRYPQLRVRILETPSVCQIARQNVREHGLESRIEIVAGDLFADKWPSENGGVLLSHVVEIFSPAKVLFIYRSGFNALVQGGRLFVWTIMANDSETAGLQAAKSSSYFLTTASGEGMAYPAKQHEVWLKMSGFDKVARYDFPKIEHGALVALRSEG